MAEYKNVISGYINTREDGSMYQVLTNLTNEDIIFKPGKEGKIFLNRTPAETLQKYPNIPHYSKSVKVEDEINEKDVEATLNANY